MVISKSISQASDLPPRSRLYPLAPLGAGTAFVESLTSYINQLAWMYRVSPRVLAIQEIIPRLEGPYQLSPTQLSNSIQAAAMRINGAGEVAINWSAALERLTMRTDLKYLNSRLWASELSTRTFLRATPACLVSYMLSGMAKGWLCHLSTVNLDAPSRDHLSKTQEEVGITVLAMPKASGQYPVRCTIGGILHSVQNLVRKAAQRDRR